jgi:hypothetical protein
MACECYKIGGPFIAEDPDCLEHGVNGYAERLERAEAIIDVLTKENERLKKEGVPGVMHEVDRAFYDLTVGQRNTAWLRIEHLEAENKRLREQLGTVQP